MSTWRRIRAALRQEKRDLDEAVEEFKTRANAALDQKERELRASPAEKLALEQERARSIDDKFDALRKRVENGGAQPQ